MDATAAMNKLVEQREHADDRVREIEAEQRLASQALVAARETLVQSERRGGGRPGERQQLPSGPCWIRTSGLGIKSPSRARCIRR
jgi:hypothetical protein